MHSLKVKALGLIRYLRPDDNPLRRQVDRMHARLIVGLTSLFILAGALVVAVTVNLVDHAGLQAEHQQARSRHSVQATVIRTTGTGAITEPGLARDTQVRWLDEAGRAHTARIPPGDHDHAGDHRAIWVDQKGEPTARPRTHYQTLTDDTLAALASLAVLGMLHAAVYSIATRQIDGRRLAMWEREWATVAPRWTGRP